MKLKFIKTKKCPICGCTTVVQEYVETEDYSKIRVHCDGAQWEHRIFLCGKEISFSPNFNMETFEGTCHNDPDYLKQCQKWKEDKEKLLNFCKDNELDKNLIARIKNYVL